MPLDTSLYNQNPLRSMADYQGQYNKLDAQNQALQQGAIALQQANPRFQAEMALKGAQTQDALAQVPLRQAQTQEAIGNTSAKGLDRQVKAHSFAMQQLPAVNTPADIVRWATEAQAQGAFGEGIDGQRAMVQGLSAALDAAKTPEGFAQWKQQASQTGQTVHEQLLAKQAAAIAAENARHNKQTETNSTENALLQAQSRLQAAGISATTRQDTRAPVAVLDDKGNAVYVPPSDAVGRTPAKMGVELSPMDKQKREAAYPTATTAVKTFESTSSETEKDLEKLMNHPGLSSITGIAAGRMPGLTADGRAAQALYDKIQARGGFSELASLKASGGTLGQVSNAEGQFLRAAFAAIDRRQNASDVQKAIADAIEKVRGARQRIKDSYDLTYEYRSGNKQESPKAPSAPQPSVSNW